jgi:hypothetical protein
MLLEKRTRLKVAVLKDFPNPIACPEENRVLIDNRIP